MPRCSTLLLTGLTALSLGSGCGGGGAETILPRTNHPNGSRRANEPKAVTGLPPMAAHRFAEVSDVVGPYVGGEYVVVGPLQAPPRPRPHRRHRYYR